VRMYARKCVKALTHPFHSRRVKCIAPFSQVVMKNVAVKRVKPFPSADMELLVTKVKIHASVSTGLKTWIVVLILQTNSARSLSKVLLLKTRQLAQLHHQQARRQKNLPRVLRALRPWDQPKAPQRIPLPTILQALRRLDQPKAP